MIYLIRKWQTYWIQNVKTRPELYSILLYHSSNNPTKIINHNVTKNKHKKLVRLFRKILDE